MNMQETEKRNKELLEEVEKLKRQVKTLRARKKYGLVWEEEKEPEQIVLDCQYKIPILKEAKSKEIISDKKEPVNILIEGDNYHALSVLNYTHRGKIDVIYIDPPYNTGSNDFKYNDIWVDAEDTYRHSKWLNFMNARLKLALNLLKNEGVILVQIDDIEIAQLRLLMDSIFGPENFRNTVVWAYRTGGAPSKKEIFAKKHDYILIYSRSKNYFFNRFKEKIIYEKDFFGAKKDSEGNYYASVNLRDVIEGEMNLLNVDDTTYKKIKIKPVLNLSKERIMDFPSQKPIQLIKYFLEIFTSKDSIILDFFAGTGTTGKSVLDINYEDKGSRRFILCTNDENSICTKICYPELRKYIKGDKKISSLGGNLRYFKTELLDVEHISHVSDEQKIKITYQAGDMIALREGTFEEVEKDEWWQIFKDGTKYTAIYFKEDKRKLNELIKKLSKLKEKVVLYIFSWGKNEYKNEFTEYKNIKVEDIPEPIIDVYKEVNRLS